MYAILTVGNVGRMFGALLIFSFLFVICDRNDGKPERLESRNDQVSRNDRVSHNDQTACDLPEIYAVLLLPSQALLYSK
jgi:hypothetical protein